MQSSLNNYPFKTVRETEKGEVFLMDKSTYDYKNYVNYKYPIEASLINVMIKFNLTLHLDIFHFSLFTFY